MCVLYGTSFGALFLLDYLMSGSLPFERWGNGEDHNTVFMQVLSLWLMLLFIIDYRNTSSTKTPKTYECCYEQMGAKWVTGMMEINHDNWFPPRGQFKAISISALLRYQTHQAH